MTPEDRKLMQQLRDAAVDLTEAYNEWYGVYLGEKTNENPYKEFIAAADARLAQPEPPVQSHDEWVKEGGRLATIAADAGYQCGKDMSTETSAAMMSAMSDFLVHLRNHPAAVPEDPPIEEVEAILACLGDDAALLREKNPECEIAANMDQAVALIRLLLAIPAADFGLSQPASEDAWLVESDRLINELAGSAIGMYAEELVNARHDLRAHLRARPAQSGYVQLKLPAAPTSRAGAKFPAGSRTSRLYDATAVVVWYDTYDEADEAADLIDKAMIEAAKESGK